MASLQKISVTRFVDRHGVQVKKGTPGARKVKEESAKWYACYREGAKQVRLPLSADKSVAQVMLADILKAKERGQVGLTDPFKQHLDTALAVHVDDYVETVKSATRSEAYHRDVKRILDLFAKNAGATILRDVTADVVSRYLTRMKCGSTSKNYYRRVFVGFFNWLEGMKRISRNPITKFTVRTVKKDAKRERRALNALEIAKLFQTVKDYPLTCSKGGRKPKTKPVVERPVTLKPAYVAMLTHRGRERSLIYRLAVLTGLRRSELSRLKVKHLELDHQPFARIAIPVGLTKNGKAAKILLVPSLASDLKNWIVESGKSSSDLLLRVPGAIQMSKLHKVHMKAAGLPYEVDGKFADFHSLRMAGNVLLRQAGVAAKERQLFLRHGTLALTTETYDDEDATEMGSVVRALQDTNL